MEDEGIVKKRTILFFVFIGILIIGLVIYFITSNNSLSTDVDPTDNPVVEDEPEDKIDESGIYGKFINLDDPNSYFEYNSDGTFKYVMNVCEGYLEYNQDNYNIVKSVTKLDGVFEAKISIKSRSNLEVININFVSKLVSAADEVVEYLGPNSCSPASNYRRI